MDNGIKAIVAKNLIELRKAKNFTQSDLAQRLNYSDKSISKWENGDSLPDIAVLAELTKIYGITLDDLIRENAAEKVDDKAEQRRKQARYNRLIILCLSVAVVFLVATLVFVYLKFKADMDYWLAFVWAVPVSCLALLYLTRRAVVADTRMKIYRVAVLSVFVWSLFAAVYLQFIHYQLWLIFILGVPIEIIIWLGSKLNK